MRTAFRPQGSCRVTARANTVRWLLAASLASMPAFAGETPVTPTAAAAQAPPANPPVEVLRSGPESGPTRKGLNSTLYSIGQPTDEEQLYLEYINRSRANPTAEGQRLAGATDAQVLAAYSQFGVDLGLMQYEFSTNPPVAPLAMNAQLLAAARWHSGDMYTNDYQAHFQTNGSTVLDPGDRMTAQGYAWRAYGENVYAYAQSVFHGHAGLNVDWGPGVGGMQDPAGHRRNINSGLYREVGIGVVDGVNGSVGPQLVTQDFATASGDTPLITGAVYYDFNTNGFYDFGEGIGGVTVLVEGSTYYAVTANSGGYAVPVKTNGTYQVRFSANGIAATQRLATVSNLQNVKVDFAPLYSPPVISGPNPAAVNQTNIYTFSAVGAATGYQWGVAMLSPYTAVEGAENGLDNVAAVTSPGYSVLANDVAASGKYSFHLAQPEAKPQYLTLKPVLRLAADSQLRFAKRLGWASTKQIARAQASPDSGQTWADVWNQPGTGGAGESGFATVTVPLGEYAGKDVQVRFVYDFAGGSYFPQTDTGVGLYLDNIAVSGAQELANEVVSDVPTSTSFSFQPPNVGTYLLHVRARLPGRILDWGPALQLSAASAPPSIQLAGRLAISGDQVQVELTVANASPGMSFQLWQASEPAGTWALDSTASFQAVVAGSKYRVTTSTSGARARFYWVKAILQ